MSPKIFITATLTLALFLGTSSATQIKSRSLKQALAQYDNGNWYGYHDNGTDYQNDTDPYNYGNSYYYNQYGDYIQGRSNGTYDYYNDTYDYYNDTDDYNNGTYSNYYNQYGGYNDTYGNYNNPYGGYNDTYGNYYNPYGSYNSTYDYYNYTYGDYDSIYNDLDELQGCSEEAITSILDSLVFISNSNKDKPYKDILNDILEFIGDCNQTDDYIFVILDLYKEFRSREMKESNYEQFCQQNYWYCSEPDTVFNVLDEAFWINVEEMISTLSDYDVYGIINVYETYQQIKSMANQYNSTELKQFMHDFEVVADEQIQTLMKYYNESITVYNFGYFFNDNEDYYTYGKDEDYNNTYNPYYYAQVSVKDMLKKRAIGDIN